MSRRSIEDKKRSKIVKALRTTPATKIDLVEYIKLRTRCTTGMANKVILSGALTVDGEPIGVGRAVSGSGVHRDIVVRYVPAELRDKIVIALPEGL